jgi:hypothetical protein
MDPEIKLDLIRYWTKEELADYIISLTQKLTELEIYKSFIEQLLKKAIG